MHEQVVDGLQRVRDVHVAVDERGRHAAGCRHRSDARPRGVAVRGPRARAPASRCHADGHRALSARARRPVLWLGLHLVVRRGCSRGVQARWAELPRASTTEGSAYGDLRPPESAESCDVASTRRESE